MRRQYGWFGLSLGLALSVAATAPVPAASSDKQVLFTSDFESGILNDAATRSPSQGWQRAGTMPVITKEQARVGAYSAKVYLNKNTSPTPYRAMINTAWDTTSDTANRTSPHAPHFQDSWVGFSVYLPSTGPGNWSKESKTYEVLVQWHDAHNPYPPPAWDTEESKNPLFSLQISQTDHAPARHWNIVYLGESRTPYPTLGMPREWKYETNKNIDAGSIDDDLDKWTDWVVRIRWNYWKVGTKDNKAFMPVASTENIAGSPTAGLIQVWKNGKLIVDQSPVQIGAHDNAGPTFSAGLYKGWRTAADRASDPIVDRLIYFDEFRYGGPNATYASVAPGGTKAPPRPKPPTTIQAER